MDQPVIGAVLGKYRILEALGEGGMGAVYRGEHLTLGSAVAIKLLHDAQLGRPGMVERFFQEARAASRIPHPGIVDVLEFDCTADGTPYLVMDSHPRRRRPALLHARAALGPRSWWRSSAYRARPPQGHWLFGLLLLIVGSAAARADGTATADRRVAAREHSLRGNAAFQESDYDRAIVEYTAANRLLRMPEFEFNLARAHRLAGHCEAAADAYRRFLAVQSTGALADEARGHLGPCPPPPPPVVEQLIAPTRPIAPAPIAVVAPGPAPATPVWKRWWLWTAVVGVGVGAGLGAGFAATSRADAARPPASLGDVEVRF